MLLADGAGGSVVRPPTPNTYPIPPSAKGTPPRTTPRAAPRSSTPARAAGGNSSSNSNSGSSGGASSGSSSSAAYEKAQADAKAEARAAEQRASARLTSQAGRLLAQADALKLALGSTGFRATLTRDLANSNLEFNEDDKLIMSQYERGKAHLEQQAGTSEDNRARSLGEATNNAGRERNEALQQGIENGISATDMIKTQGASLRNWAFNAGQVQTNYSDEINGIQSENSQMVNSVVTSRQASWREREQQRTQLYRGYYDNRGQVLTEVGNKQGEAGQYYDMANEQVDSGSSKAKAKTSNANALANLKAAALETGKSYKELATPASITAWQGTAKIKNSTDPRQWGKQELEIKDAEGASTKLRKWEE